MWGWVPGFMTGLFYWDFGKVLAWVAGEHTSDYMPLAQKPKTLRVDSVRDFLMFNTVWKQMMCVQYLTV